MLARAADAYGRIISDHARGVARAEVIERDDGWFGTSAGAPAYFAPFEKWPLAERRAIRHARGRVLDVGCGAGRVALHLQDRGHAVVATDISPLAVRTCRQRGVREARVVGITGLDRRLGRFDTVVMFGNNFGLFDYLIVSPREMRTIVAGTGWRLARLVRARGPLYVGVLEKE